MKLVYLSNSVIPSRSANSIHVMKMCQAFAQRGLDVHLLCSSYTEVEMERKNPFHFYSVEPAFSIHKVKWFNRLPGKYFIFALFTAFKSILLNANIVYGRYLFGVYTAALFGKTVVFETHSDEFNQSRIHYHMVRMLVAWKKCKKIVVISAALREAYIESFPDCKKKIVTAHDGADPKPALTSSPFNTKFIAGYIGHLYKGKGMEIVKKIVPECPDIFFLIVGGLEKDLTCWREECKELDNIEFSGFIPHHQTDRYLAQMDIVLAPYQNRVSVHGGTIDISRWMSPLKIFEYMAAGKPIISSNLPVIREVLQHGENALLCKPDDIQGWIKSIRLLQNDHSLRKYISMNARCDFESLYTWKKRAEMLTNHLG